MIELVEQELLSFHQRFLLGDVLAHTDDASRRPAHARDEIAMARQPSHGAVLLSDAKLNVERPVPCCRGGEFPDYATAILGMDQLEPLGSRKCAAIQRQT